MDNTGLSTTTPPQSRPTRQAVPRRAMLQTMTTSLHSPGQLLANIPGILGFYPHESLIFVAFHHTPTAHRYTLGPVLRIDLSDLHLLPDVGTALHAADSDLIFAFLVTEEGPARRQEIIDLLFDAAEAGEPDIQACWVSGGILTGEPYHLGFGPAPGPGTGEGSTWEHGVIAPVTQAPAMSPLIEQGQLPELTREEAFDHFARFNPALPIEKADQLEDFAARHAEELVRAITKGQDGEQILPALLDDHALLLTELAEGGTSPEDLGVELMADEETLTGTAVLLSDSLLRDALLGESLHRPATAAALFLAVARTFGGQVRANALALYALVALELRLSMRAVPALVAALEEVPGHQLSTLVLQSCRVGAFSEVLAAADRGSRVVRSRYGNTGELSEIMDTPDAA